MGAHSYAFDIKKIASDAMTYGKIHEAKKDITIDQVVLLLKEALCEKKFM